MQYASAATKLERSFEKRHEALRHVIDDVIYGFYMPFIIGQLAQCQDNKDKFDYASAFWVGVTRSAYYQLFIGLDKLYDHNSKYSLYKYFQFIEQNPQIFSKESLRQRKIQQGGFFNLEANLNQYLHAKPIVDVKRTINKSRVFHKRNKRLYVARVEDLRNKYFAHAVITTGQLEKHISHITYKDLYKLVNYPYCLHSFFWEIYSNGNLTKPKFLPFNIKNMVLGDEKLPGSIKYMVQHTLDTVNAIRLP